MQSTQEQFHEQHHIFSDEAYLDSALIRSVRLMAEARQRWGTVPPEIKAMILDEELTPVLEVVVDQTTEAYGVVPRSFRVEADDLIDPHGQSLTGVAERGSRWSRQEVKQGVPGAWNELQRRNTEAKNIAKIARMPAGSLLVEVSANPIDWTAEERTAQHYTGLTMIRASVKPYDDPNEVLQFNYVLPNLDTPEAILNLQNRLEIENDGQTIDTNKMLAHPLEKAYDGSALAAGREIDGLLGATLLEKSVGHSALRMIQRAIERRREAWRFITNNEQSDVHSELLAHIEWLATRHPQFWEQELAPIRTGFTRELKDRFLNRHLTTSEVVAGSIIVAAASRAAEAGDVYIACGTIVTATEFSTQTASAAGRAEAVKSLLENVVGEGECSACGVKGSLYGCGLCSGCNKKWCDIFVMTGNQTAIKNLASSRRQAKAVEQPQQKSPKETEWQKIVREDNEKKIVQKQKRLEKQLARKAA